MNYLEQIQSQIEGRYRSYLLKKTVATSGPYTITQRKRYYGIDHSGLEIVQTVFDGITIYPQQQCAVLDVNGHKALYDLRKRQVITPFNYTDITITPGHPLAKLTADNGLCAIYDTDQRQYVAEQPLYTEFNSVNDTTEYIWAKESDTCYSFIKRSDSSVIIRIFNITLPYDTFEGILALTSSGRASYYDHNGIERSDILRQLVIKKRGYMLLGNDTYNKYHHIDVYGNILNP